MSPSIRDKTRRVLVAMSGGVDSSVAAAILKENGYQVVGVTMKIWECGENWTGCCGVYGVEDARRVAHRLGIPHYVIDLREVFEEKVVKPFCRAYLEGKTPNPCILCNRHLKFGELLNKADELGIHYVATGHYARIDYDKEADTYFLKKGLDSSKDQSYFLYVLTQEHLRRTLFPVGNLTKGKVRKKARDLRLHIAEKKGSQEICFVANGNYRDFLITRTRIRPEPGPILSMDGVVLGYHKGIVSYTIGQRRGLGISAPDPLYVVAIDPRRNAIIVGNKDEVYCKGFSGEDVTFVTGREPGRRFKAEVRVRYRQPTQWATITVEEDGKVKVVFDEPRWGVAPGQSAVFYDDDKVLGGAIIDSTLR